MSNFKQESNILKREFSKRTIHSGDQFIVYEVTIINDNISIEIASSQLTKGRISGNKDVIELIIGDLQEAIEL